MIREGNGVKTKVKKEAIHTMDIVQQTITFIQKVTQNPDVHSDVKYQDAIWDAGFLEDRFEYNSMFTAKEDIGKFSSKEDVGKASSLLLDALLKEKDEAIRAVLLEVLASAVGNNDVYAYINFEKIVNLLPHLSFGLADAIYILGYSHQKKYLTILEKYLDQDEGVVFDAMCRIWWDVSGHDSEVEQLLKKEEFHQVEFRLNNLKKQTISEDELKSQYIVLRNDVLKDMKRWFKQHNNV